MMISRRQFLRGKFSAARTPAQTMNVAAPIQIGSSCIAFNNVVCRSCGDACGETAIRFSPRLGGAALPELIAGRCTGCGVCIPACPASAITLSALAVQPGKR
jgi:ferredoxin-type protein NapF